MTDSGKFIIISMRIRLIALLSIMAIPNFPELERRILQDWKDTDIFGQTLRKASPRGRFVFFDGPPTANDSPHDPTSTVVTP